MYIDLQRKGALPTVGVHGSQGEIPYAVTHDMYDMPWKSLSNGKWCILVIRNGPLLGKRTGNALSFLCFLCGF